VNDAEAQLRALNVEIGNAESRGDAPYFEALLAPAFAMRRADGTSTTDRDAFLAAVKQSPARETAIEQVAVLGAGRAFVTCVITMPMPGGPRRFHNARLFTRKAGSDPWQVLAWANEPIP
jgi:hypothetical protein